MRKKILLTATVVLALLMSMVLVQKVKVAEAEILGPLKLPQNGSSVTISSPQNITYYEDSVLVKFTVTAFIYIYEVGYSLDDGLVQRITDLRFIKSEPSRGYSPNGVTNDVTYEGRFYLTDLENGNHSLTIYQGHQYPDSYHVYRYSSVNFTIDSQPPNISLSIENKTYNQTALPLNFTVDKEVSWVGYSLDGEANVTLTGNTTLAIVPDGAHSIVVYANDTAGNMGKSPTVQFTVETEPSPTPTPSPSPTPTPSPTSTPAPTPTASPTSKAPQASPQNSLQTGLPHDLVYALLAATAVFVGVLVAVVYSKRRALGGASLVHKP